MEQIKKYKILTSIGIFLAAVTVTVFFIVLPMIEKIENKANEIQRKIVDYELNQSRLSKLPEMEERHAIFERHKSDLDVIISSDKDVDLIKTLESLAEQTGNIVTMQISDAEEKKSPKKDSEGKSNKEKEDLKLDLPYDNYIVIQLMLEGNYEQFLNYLSRLENLKYYVNVTSVVLTKAEKEIEAETTDKNKQSEEKQKKEVLKSLIELVVFVKK